MFFLCVSNVQDVQTEPIIVVILQILSSEEGVELRAKHQQVVQHLRKILTEAGLPVVHCPSHIIPLHVGDSKMAEKISNDLLFNHGYYVQAINPPTVPRGEEKLRIAVTPYHTPEMMEQLTSDLVQIWNQNGLPLDHRCAESSECTFCKRPLIFSVHENRATAVPRSGCDKPYCPRLGAAAA